MSFRRHESDYDYEHEHGNRILAGVIAIGIFLLLPAWTFAQAAQSTPAPSPTPQPTATPRPAATPALPPAATPTPYISPQGAPIPRPTPVATPPRVIPAATPIASPRPTPTPAPAPAGAQTAPDGGPSVPLIVLDKQKAITQLNPRLPEAKIEFAQMRLIRTLNAGGREAMPEAVMRVTANGPMRDIFTPGLSMIFRITTPDHCGILDITGAALTQVKDQRGRTIMRPANAPVPENALPQRPDSLAIANVLSWGEREALVQFTTGLPDRADVRLAQLEATVDCTIGVVRPITVSDLRRRIGQPIFSDPAIPNLTMRLDSITTEQLVIVAEGQVSRLGEMEFFGANNEEFQPYSKTREEVAVPPDNHPRATYRFLFFNLPQVLTLRVAYYPQVEAKKLKVTMENTPLP